MSASETRSPNRLAGETSPYLLQHAYNPVDWYPWGPEALEKAKQEDKPILLSVGYAACHWCHVMERESFEDEATARLMNEKFVCIKVDREERPDIDAIYMDAVQAMTGRGGWPMTMFLTPAGKPFYGGTYFPPEDRHGLPGFKTVLNAIHDAWTRRRQDVEKQTSVLVEHISEQAVPASDEPFSAEMLSNAVRSISSAFDFTEGGFGGAPKFPNTPAIEFLLRAAAGNLGRSPEMVKLTLRKMAMGGIYDQVGGGFSRYSVDEFWLVPHFEKMLYDNAQLARVYLRAWQIDKSPLFKRIAVETLEYLMRDMRDGSGAFYASEDADSEGEEGKFYVWEYDEFMQVAPDAAQHYGVTPEGNFEGRNILTAAGEQPPADARKRLFEARQHRVRPGRDEKILTSWNGLAVSALAEAAAAFGRPDFEDAAAGAAGFLLSKASGGGGRLLHSYKDGRGGALGMLEDYAYLSEGLFTLWEVTFDPAWLKECRRLCDDMLELFWDAENGGLFLTGSDHEQLIARPKEIIDSATPSPNGVAALVLEKLAVATGQQRYAEKAGEVLKLGHVYMQRAPQVAGTLLCALDFRLSTPREIVVIGDRAGAAALLNEVWSRYIPNRVLAGAAPGAPAESPMLEGKAVTGGKPTAFVCENYSCRAPTTDPAELAAQLS